MPKAPNSRHGKHSCEQDTRQGQMLCWGGGGIWESKTAKQRSLEKTREDGKAGGLGGTKGTQRRFREGGGHAQTCGVMV